MWRRLPGAKSAGHRAGGREGLGAPGPAGRVWRPGRCRSSGPGCGPGTTCPSAVRGPTLRRADYAAARARAREVARATLGEALWAQLKRQGYLDVPSTLQPGLTYRLRVGRRIEVRCAPGVRSPWPVPYLCINPTYPLPEEEFFAQLYLYVRDRRGPRASRRRSPAVGSGPRAHVLSATVSRRDREAGPYRRTSHFH